MLREVRQQSLVKEIARNWFFAKQRMRDVVGQLQLTLGAEPTMIGTPRLALQQWKAEVSKLPEPQSGSILVAAIRNRRWVEWAVYSACYLLSMGYRPTIVFSGSKIVQFYGQGSNNFWSAAQSLPHFMWIDLDPLMDARDLDVSFEDFARQGAHTVAAYDLEVEEYENDEAPGEYEAAIKNAEPMLRRYATAFYQVLQQHPGQRLICPSGLIGESLAVYEAAQRLDHEVMYIEGWALRPGHNIWNFHRPALEYDVEGWLKALQHWSGDLERDIQDYMAFREGERVNREGWLDNFHQVQRSSRDHTLPPRLTAYLQRSGPFVLLGTNVVGDSSTLRRQTIFRSQREWLEHTIKFFRQRPDLNLIIRAHPDELWVRARLRLADWARTYAEDAENIFVIGGEEDVNTYRLIEEIDLGLAWVSNVGLDIALRGKPVVMAAKPKYTGLGVVHEPATRDEYFGTINRLIEKPVGPDAEAIGRGKAYHYIVFKLLSLEADDRRYNAANYRLGSRYRREEQHRFYRILAGELDNYGR